ncbi:MAG: hypothetical protein IPP77_14030 [Bacteroidetes bacterium]|nr:hypothetical protein [Bacteroidota bacterium]
MLYEKTVFDFILVALFSTFYSCQKSGVTLPVINFYAGTGYVYSDTVLAHGTIATFGINAYKAGVDQLLRKCIIQRSINGSADSTIQEMDVITQTFSQFYGYTVGDSGNVERYTFIILQDNGLSDSAIATITSI